MRRPTGFSVEFFPECVILGCGPDSARAYPYTVTANGGGAAVKIDAPDHPLTLAFRPDGSLDPGATGPYQVHGRMVVGQDDNDDFTFAPMEATCNLAVLAPSSQIPMTGGVAAAADDGWGRRPEWRGCSGGSVQRRAMAAECLRRRRPLGMQR